jgi:hypothetical protein
MFRVLLSGVESVPRPPKEQNREKEEEEKGENLKREASKENVICRRRIRAVRLCLSYQSGTRDLDPGSYNIASYKSEQDESRLNGGIVSSDFIDEDGEDRVNARAEHYWCHDYEEVLNYKVDYEVRVALWYISLTLGGFLRWCKGVVVEN